MWILPTRGRPKNLKRFFDLYETTQASQWGIVYVDDDDSCLEEYKRVELADGWKMVVSPRIGLGATINKAFTDNPNEPFYGMITDDSIPVTPKWDVLLSEAAGDKYIAYCSNDTNKFGHCCLGGDLVRELGWIILPGLVRLYGEDVLLDIGREKNCLRHVPVFIDHYHFTTGKSQMDETYMKPEASADKAIYEAWRKVPPLTVCCIKWGTLYGAEYVNRLYQMVQANLPEGFHGKFVCFTEDGTGLLPGIQVRDIPIADLTGWWTKLSLFKADVFPKGERVFFFDLDTVITGDLENILSYRGDFALLRDFYRPEGYGSGVMAWEAGKCDRIWKDYDDVSRASGFWIDLDGGDQAWIERVWENATRLQDVYPGAFVSYKVDCGNGRPPKDARVVCFHGEPKPHNCGSDWVKLVWEDGKILSSAMCSVPNTDSSTMQDNIIAACKRPIPWLKREEPHDQIAVMVGGGPSTKEFIWEIKERQSAGQIVVSMNGSFQFLLRNGITADWHVVMDARLENLKFVAGVHPRKGLLLSSQCHPKLFDGLNGSPVELFHNYTSTAVSVVKPPEGTKIHFVGGGNTVGLASIASMYSRGFRTFALYGYDSSYRSGKHHAYAQALNNKDRVIEATVNGTTFQAAGWMVDQVNQFQELATQLANAGCEITVHGDGLLPTVAREMARQFQGDRHAA